jgi:hypothetical protein
MHKGAQLGFSAWVALSLDLPIELASIEHSLTHALLQVGDIRIDQPRFGLPLCGFWKQRGSDEFANGLAIPVLATWYIRSEKEREASMLLALTHHISCKKM